MKKLFLSLFLILCFIFSGCGTDEKETPLPPEAEQKEAIADFFGATFIITSPWIQYINPRFMYKTEVLTVTQERLQAWWEKAQTDLNAVFEPGDSVDQGLLQAAVASGTHYADIMYITGANMYTYAKADLLVPLDQLQNIDVHKEADWNLPINRTLGTYKGTCYGVQRANSYGGIRGGLLAYNQKYINEFSLEDPYEHLELKDWTFDTFSDMLSRAGDTDSEHTVYPLSSCNTVALGRTAVIANGASIVTEEKTFGYVEEKALTALDWLSSITSDSSMYKKAENTSGFFAQGGSTFSHDEAWLHLSPYEYCSSMNDITYFFIRFPYGPDADYGTFSPSFNSDSDQVYCIAGCTDNAEDSAYVLTYFKGSERYYSVYPEYKDLEEDWENEYFSRQSYEEFLFAQRNLQLVYPYELKDVNNVIEAAITSALNGSKTPLEAMSSIKDNVETYITNG